MPPISSPAPRSISALARKYAAAIGIAAVIGLQLGVLALVCPSQVGFAAETPDGASPAKKDILNVVCRKPTLA